MAHNLNFHTSDCHTLQLGKQKKANSVIVENNPLKEQKNLRKAWFKEMFQIGRTVKKKRGTFELILPTLV